jgi:glycosyltransferase involved in cell wall biosynthesis
MKIIYLCPATTRPSGGVKRIFRHVDTLCRAGYDAYVGLPHDAVVPSWFDLKVPVAFFSSECGFDPGDVAVAPDAFLDVIKPLKDSPIRKVVLALGFSSLLYRPLPQGKSWPDYGVEAVITHNKEIAEMIYYSRLWPADKEIGLVSTGINRSLYQYDPEVKKLQVASLNKDNDRAFMMAQECMHRRDWHWSVDFKDLRDYNEKDYAKILRESDVFVTQMMCEGFSVPILEAMACGCICVGSHGVGGNSFVVNDEQVRLCPENRLVEANKNMIETIPGDLFGLIKGLDEALSMCVGYTIKQKDQCERIRNNAIATAAQFTVQEEEESILEFWQEFLK